MRSKMPFVLFMIVVTLIPASLLAQQVRQDVGTKILIPSSVKSATFTSFLAVLNLDSQANTIEIKARRSDGSSIGQSKTVTLPVGGRFRSTDILTELGGGAGEFGPITVESTNNRVLAAVSEVTSSQGPGGFFPGINVNSAWQTGFISEVIDTGNAGTARTYRTNIGVNTVSGTQANVTVILLNNSGAQVGVPVSFSVSGNGMTQRNLIMRDLLASGGGVTNQNGYLKITSNQPVIAWASKIENASGDPSFQIGVGAASTVVSQIAADAQVAQNNVLFVGLGMLGPIAFCFASRRKEICQRNLD
jgi:hypothetical protein